ncbi:WhiB family transcriptional regulator [Microbacterium sp. 22296]|uniref:WhiB family transcriptional regulator n=1 Tax=Microbacterium sp. 22296 TaxID=3453903 RepID=UPI003F86E168
MTAAVPGRLDGRPSPTPGEAPSVTSSGPTPTGPASGPSRLRTTPSVPEECHQHGLPGCLFCVPPVTSTRKVATVGEVEAARGVLNDALGFAREVSVPVPCLGPDGTRWTSDDPREQGLAAEACAECPLLAQCGNYARLAREPAGVWGGRVHAARAGHRDAVDVVTLTGATPKRPPSDGSDCLCGCDGRTRGGWYRPGHDVRHVGTLAADVRAGRVPLDQASRALAHSPRLGARLVQQLGRTTRRG